MSISFNAAQQRAIEHVHGPMLVVAGAGTGKTTVLVERIARLIRQDHAKPSEILAVTYTDNAARELGERVQTLLGSEDLSGLRTKTFHAYCFELLQRNGRGFKVLDQQDLYIYLRRRLRDLELNYYTRAVRPAEFLEALLEFFSRCHDELVDVNEYERYVERLCRGEAPLPRVVRSSQVDETPAAEVVERCREIAKVYRKVEQMLAADNFGTFGHMILRAVQLLRAEPELLERERRLARFLLIDEFQDANLGQIEMAQLLGGKDANVFAVGDPDQAIYRFRGASSAAFAEFAKRFPNSAGVVLDENQRSLTPVLNCSFSVISSNPAVHCVVDGSGQRFERRRLVSAREMQAQQEGRPSLAQPTELTICRSDEEEAAEVARVIEELRDEQPPLEPVKPREGQLDLFSSQPAKPRAPRFAVLYRAHGHREKVMEELAARGIPAVVRGVNALETCEVRDVMACLRAIASPGDAENLFRVSALPVFGLDPLRVRAEMWAAGRDAKFAAVLEKVPGGKEVLDTLAKVRTEAEKCAMAAEPVLRLALRSFDIDPNQPPVRALCGFIEKWRAKPLVQSGSLEEFLEYMDYFPEAGGVLELPSDADESDHNAVQLMTAHVAKGLEFEHVFVLKLNQGSFPTMYREKLFEFPAALQKSIVAEGDSSEVNKQEERRLFYVAMTRARDTLTICARPGVGKRDPRPNAFVRELMDDVAAKPFWRQHDAAPVRLAIAAGALATAGVGEWLLIPPTDNLQNASLSATAVEIYEKCPLQFKLERDWRVPGQVAAAMQYGNVMHTVLKDYFDAVLAKRQHTREESLDVFHAKIAEMHFDDPLQRDLYVKQGERQLTEFIAKHEAAPLPQVLSTERSFELRINGVLVRGRVDRLDVVSGKRVEIIDYKTGTARDEAEARRSLQLSIYAIAARDIWDLEPERLAIYNLEDNSKVASTRTDGQLVAARQRVSEAANGIANGHFDPKPGFHCRFCAYRNLCPATEQHVPRARVETAV